MPGATVPFSTVGSKIEIATGAPTTFDATGYAAVTPYVEIGEIEDIGEYGAEDSILSRTPLKTGVVQKLKGGTDFGTLPLQSALVLGDPGHVAVIAAQASKNAYTFRITYQDGTKDYFRALVTSYKKGIGGSEGFTKCSINLAITTATVTVTPP